MLPKKNRADTKEVELIFKKSIVLSSPNLTFRYFKNNTKEVKISFIAPKNIAKSAVERNFLRRCGYSALEKYIDLSPLDVGIIGVFVFKTRPNGRGLSVGREYQEDKSILGNEIKSILSKIS